MIEPLKNFEGLNITFNTNEDCNLACKYACIEGTKILMGDLTEKCIQDVMPGDIIIGFDEYPDPHKYRKFHNAKVMAAGFTEIVDHYYLFETEVTSVGLSGPHPLLNQNNKFIFAEDFYNSKGINKKIYVDFLPRKGDTIEAINKGGRKIRRISINKPMYAKYNVSIKKINERKRVFNLTTSSRTYIANGVLVHNCYEIEKKHRILPFDYAKKFIDWILTDPDPINCVGTKDEWIIDQGLILDFIGGDSFMHVDLMDEILQYFIYRINTIKPYHKWANRWRVSISSNGTLFERKECRDFITKWNEVLSLGISIDGCPTIHDKNRIFAERGPNGEEIGSMATILKWWPWLRKVNSNICRNTKATCSRDSIPYLAESLKFMHEELGITYINQNFIMEDMNCTESDYEELRKQLDLCVDYVLKHRHMLYWSMMDERFLKRITDPDVDLNEGWCGSGAMPALAVNGKIYPCFRWLPHTQEKENESEAYCVGDVWNGFNRKENFRKVRNATRRVISPPECLECEYEPCCSYCATPNTPILMADFTQKAIKDVVPGDNIMAFGKFITNDPHTWEEKRYSFCVATVTKTFEREVDEDIHVDANNYGFTREHPFLTQFDSTLTNEYGFTGHFRKLEQIIDDNQSVFLFKLKMLDNDINDNQSVFLFKLKMLDNDPVFTKSVGISSQAASFVKTHYKGKVHNLETSTHTYIGGGYLVHNCVAGCYSEFGCFKRTTHICEVTKIIAQAAEKYWKEYDRLEGTDHFSKRIAK
jgi:uncharacterized protein